MHNLKELIREELPENWQETISQENFNIANIQVDRDTLFRATECSANR